MEFSQNSMEFWCTECNRVNEILHFHLNTHSQTLPKKSPHIVSGKSISTFDLIVMEDANDFIKLMMLNDALSNWVLIIQYM